MRERKRDKTEVSTQENESLRLHLCIRSFLSSILEVGNLVIILIERLTRLLQLSLHA